MSQNQNQSSEITAARQQAITLCQSGKFEQAKSLLEALKQNIGMDAESYFMLGSICGQLQDFESAVRYFREAITLQPNSPQVYFALGKALVQLGVFSEAEASFNTSVELRPGFLHAVLELAKTHCKLGKLEEAEKGFKQILESEPGSLQALMGLGRIYQTWDKLELAINYFRKSLEINPELDDAHYHLGHIYLNQSQIEEAEKSYRHALRINPSHVQAYMDMGYLNMIMNRVPEAKAAFQEALAIQPDNLDAIVGRAQIYEQLGDIEAATAQVMPFIERGVKNIGLGTMFSKICRHSGLCEKAVDYLEELLSDAKDPTAKVDKIHFALGKLYDYLGDYDMAFSHYQQGNSLKADTFNSVEHKACIDQLIKVCDWNFFVSAPRATQLSARPVFIVGMPRSGTTLTEQILSSHPDVFGAGEIIVFPDIIRNLPTVLGSGTIYPESLRKLSVDILDFLSESYLAEIEKLDADAARVTDKTLSNFLYLGLISLMFPNARVIHCMRDPRDTCLSIYFQNFDESHGYATRLDNLGNYYNEYNRLMDHWKGILDMPILEVQYEDVVKDQENMSRKLIEFVGLPWDERVLRFYETKRSVVTASYDQVRQKIYTKSAQRWKNYEKHIGLLDKSLGSQ